MHDKQTAAPDSTAVRVALWRAVHGQIDPPPHVLEDEIGLRLVAPEADWRRPWFIAGSRRLRCPPAVGRDLCRRQHVPHQGRDHGYAAPGCGARLWIHTGDELPAAAGTRGP